MSTIEQTLRLQFKQALGSVQHLDYTDVNAPSAHHRLAAHARAQIWHILSGRLQELGSARQVAEQIRLARQAREALKVRLQIRGLTENVREALGEYMACLEAWAAGAALADFHHAWLAEDVKALDLATLLQDDEVGCQTGAYREPGGGLILWHTEEDGEKTPGERFDQLRLCSFRASNGRTATGFIYPDLLPGPSFAWQGGDYAQAIDSLHVRFANAEQAILPNCLAWLSLYLGAQGSPAALAKQLGPFRGGYSLSTASKINGQMNVEKVEYANDALHVSHLENSPGCHLFQTNIIRDLNLPIGAEERTSPESRAWNEKRLARTRRFLQVIRRAPEPLPLILRMLRSRLGNDSAYANHDVKGYLVCRMTAGDTRIWVGSGPPMPGDELFSVINA